VTTPRAAWAGTGEAPSVAERPIASSGEVRIGGAVSGGHTSFSDGSGTADSISLSAKIDYFFAPHWFIGLAAGGGFLTNNIGNQSTSSRQLDVGPRLGVVLPISEIFALRPVIAGSIQHAGTDMNDSKLSWTRAVVTARLEFALAVSHDVALTAGLDALSLTFGQPSNALGAAPMLGAGSLGIEVRL